MAQRGDCRQALITLDLDLDKVVLAIDAKTRKPYVVVHDDGFSNQMLSLHKDCKFTLIVIACCPPEKPAREDTVEEHLKDDHGGGKSNMGCTN